MRAASIARLSDCSEEAPSFRRIANETFTTGSSSGLEKRPKHQRRSIRIRCASLSAT